MQTISQNIVRDSGLAMFKWVSRPWRLMVRRGQAPGAALGPDPHLSHSNST